MHDSTAQLPVSAYRLILPAQGLRSSLLIMGSEYLRKTKHVFSNAASGKIPGLAFFSPVRFCRSPGFPSERPVSRARVHGSRSRYLKVRFGLGKNLHPNNNPTGI